MMSEIIPGTGTAKHLYIFLVLTCIGLVKDLKLT